MTVTIKRKSKAAGDENPLLKLRSKPEGGGRFDWNAGFNDDQPKEAVTLNAADERTLNAVYAKVSGGRYPNLERAREIKALMIEGNALLQIIRILRPKGEGYGEQSIRRDYAALNKTTPLSTSKARK